MSIIKQNPLKRGGFSFWAARHRARRADFAEGWHFAQKSAQNFVDYYLLTNPDKCGIISMSRGEEPRGRHLQDFHLIKAPIKFFEKLFKNLLTNA
jgi:hypothetical protein